MALAHSTRIHVEGMDVAALRVIVRTCSVLWVWRSVTNQIEPCIMISLSRCIQTELDRWMVSLSFTVSIQRQQQ